MSRYLRRPMSSGWVEDETFSPDPAHVPSISVPEHEAVHTGLLWPDGSPVLRALNPIGFGRMGEWS